MINGKKVEKPVAKKIAGYHKLFLCALKQSSEAEMPDVSTIGTVKQATKSRTVKGGIGAVLGSGAAVEIAVELKNSVSSAIENPVDASKVLAEGTKQAADNLGQVADNVGIIASTFGLDQSQLVGVLSWSLFACLALVIISGIWILYARYDDARNNNNPFKGWL